MPNKHLHQSRELLPVEDALSKLLQFLPKTSKKEIRLDEAIGHRLAENLVALRTTPQRDISSMDGFAVCSKDIKTLPARLTRIAESSAGHPWPGKLKTGEGVRIFTGGQIPDGADSIVIQENVTIESDKNGEKFTVNKSVQPGRYIRPAGLDFKNGEIIADSGSLISARVIALAAAAGHQTLLVSEKPKIGVLSTGDELIAPGQKPRPEQIYNSNSNFLFAFINSNGGDAVNMGIVRDAPGEMLDMVRKANSLDLVVTTGGASVGKYDHIVSDLKSGHLDQSSGINFWKIAMRPGKPLVYGNVDNTPILGLPGNPVSTAICALVFLRPAIAHMSRGKSDLPKFQVPVSVCLEPNDHRQDYVRANLEINDFGQTVRPAQLQDSSMLATLANANALIIRPPYDPAKKVGDLVTIFPTPDLF